MANLVEFERIVRRSGLFSEEPATDLESAHPFASRDIHPLLPDKVMKLFDDAHYLEATFHAAKFVDVKVAALAGLKETGASLMKKAFSERDPKIKLSDLVSESEINEQKGYMWLFVGMVWAIRNPRGHEFQMNVEQSLSLDHLSFISMLMRRLEVAGYVF